MPACIRYFWKRCVKIFNQENHNPHGAQLIFNTHTTDLLSKPVLRRDQIWFTEKDNTGATRLYPLSDFKPRRDENLQRGYSQGRYGATPTQWTAQAEGEKP